VNRTLRIATVDVAFGGERAYVGRLGKDRSARQSRRSIASAK
jgi:hypothetical protein